MNLEEVDVFYTPQEIHEVVSRLGQEITQAYMGEKLVVVGILKGSFVFMADLVRQIDLSMTLDFMDVSSYGDSSVSSGEVRILKDLDDTIEGQHVLVVEDIIDSGLTLQYLLDVLRARNPASLKTCCMLDKPSRRVNAIKPDFYGYVVPDEFIVGYGLDYDEKYRNYPALCILKEFVYQKDKEV